MRLPIHRCMAESVNVDECCEGRQSLASWQWDLIGGLVGIVVSFGVGWWVAGMV